MSGWSQHAFVIRKWRTKVYPGGPAHIPLPFQRSQESPEFQTHSPQLQGGAPHLLPHALGTTLRGRGTSPCWARGNTDPPFLHPERNFTYAVFPSLPAFSCFLVTVQLRQTVIRTQPHPIFSTSLCSRSTPRRTSHRTNVKRTTRHDHESLP